MIKHLHFYTLLQNQIIRGIFIFLFIAECAIGMVGNFLVCLTVYWNKSMQSPVNCYIVNLSICDFLVGAVVLPIKVSEFITNSIVHVCSCRNPFSY